jgi:amino acid adenylation domain-containing protein
MRRQDMQRSKAGYSDIQRSSNTQYYPLSFQQERVLYLNKLSAEGPLWNRISCKRLVGKINVPLLKEAIDALIERHSALRTRIRLVEGIPLQSRHEALDAFESIDLSTQAAPGVEEQARAILNREYEKPLPLEGGQLFKAVLVRCSDSEVWLILKLHHIISDERTFRILWNDLKALYNAQFCSAGVLRTLELEYFDYAKWVREQLGEDHCREQECYWLGQFAGQLPELDLPTDSPAPPNLTFSGALEKQRLPQQLIKRVQSFSLERRVIPFSIMLSAYYLLLHNYCRQDDIVVGTVFSGRHYSPKLKLIAGFFSNTVALRARLDNTQTAEEFVKFIHGQVTDAYEMQDYPFERLVDRLDPGREHKRNPLFRAMFNMVTGYEERVTFQGIYREEWLEPEISATQVDFFLDFHMDPNESELRIEYNADIFSKATVQRMMRHYITIVEKIVDSPTANARELSMLDAAEEKLVLSLGEGDSERIAFTRSIVELLEERAARTPEQAALLFADEVITCGQLNKRVNQLAATLIEAGVAEGGIVAIMVDRSPEMVIGVLAILKAGAAYLPIDPAFPQQRIEYILRDSGVNCLLVQGDAAHALTQNNCSLSLIYIAVENEDSYTGDGSNTGRKVGPLSPAYVIYTSGSTGKPKGVVVEHRALMNTLEFLEARYPLTGKTILLKTNFTFDVSAAELFGWLFDGGRLALLDKGAERDPGKLIEAIDKYRVTHINFVPSMLDGFLSGLQERDIPTLERLEYVFVAGEALKPDLVNRFHSMILDVRLENLYGPTEAAIYATWYSLPRGKDSKRVPIGKPISNMRSYILDENLRLIPVGLTGELCLSGVGLARGYLNQPELTNEKFCPNPYREGERIYRTGDLAKWRDDGLIQFLGRADGQVKIRGFRVELGEVERKLLACHAVAEAAVTAKTDQFGQKGLVAYLTMKEGRDGSLGKIREELAAWLPSYMIPEFFVDVERLPRLPSGKVDLQALPEPGRNSAPPAERRVAPTELEKTIIEIAEGLLNTTGLGPNSNFFRLGGNSLLTLRFVAALDNALGTSLSVMDFLELPTISEIAKLIEASIPRSRTSEEVVSAGRVAAVARNRPTTAWKG